MLSLVNVLLWSAHTSWVGSCRWRHVAPDGACRRRVCDVPQVLKLFHHGRSVGVELVNVTYKLPHVVRHGREFCLWEFVVTVHWHAGYHSVLSRVSSVQSLRCSASLSHLSRAATALSCAFVGLVVL